MINVPGEDVFWATDTFDIGRNFGNKLWNASRFLLENIQDSTLVQELQRADGLVAFDKGYYRASTSR